MLPEDPFFRFLPPVALLGYVVLVQVAYFFSTQDSEKRSSNTAREIWDTVLINSFILPGCFVAIAAIPLILIPLYAILYLVATAFGGDPPASFFVSLLKTYYSPFGYACVFGVIALAYNFLLLERVDDLVESALSTKKTCSIMNRVKTCSIMNRVLSFLRNYGVAVGLFVFGVHLHAQVEEWTPLWDNRGLGDLLGAHVENPEGQTVTARWLMLAGTLIWVGVHYGLFERLRGQERR